MFGIDKLLNNEQQSLLYELEIKLAVVLAKMEMAGFTVSKKRLNEIGEFVLAELKRLEQEIYELAGSTFNIMSPVQLAKVLFEDLGIKYPIHYSPFF